MKIIKDWRLIASISTLLVIYLSSFYNYLLFHGIAETFSVLIAFSVFLFSWNSREYFKHNYFLFIGVAYLFIGTIDMAHTFAYKGMGVFTGIDANHPTQLWIAARYLESLSLLLAFQFFKRRLNPYYLFAAYLLITLLIFSSIFYWEVFPDCFIEGSGLTVFKKTSEYIISAILLGVIACFYKYRNLFDKNIFRLLITSTFLTIIAELAFTFYVSVFGLSNLIGHLCKIISFYLIYKAIIITGLKEPFSILLKDLKQSEDQLKLSLREKETLLQEIHHRVKNNMNVVSGLLNLHKNSTQNEEVKKALQESQGRVYAMSSVHETLYNSENLAEIDLMDYLNKLSSLLLQTYSVNPGKVQLKINGDEVTVDINKASPLGLSVNELISNALKYAFPDDRKGKIEVNLQKQDDRLALTIQDNGVGMPKGFDWRNSNTLGLKLVRSLIENQLNGSIDVNTQDGTQFTITISLDA